MLPLVTGVIGAAAALTIIYLIRRDHLHVRYGLWWIAVAAAFVVLGLFPGFIDRLASLLGIAYGPTLALTLGLTIFVIKMLTIDIARSRNETRIVRMIQRIAMLEAELERLRSDREDARQAEKGGDASAGGGEPKRETD